MPASTDDASCEHVYHSKFQRNEIFTAQADTLNGPSNNMGKFQIDILKLHTSHQLQHSKHIFL